jgi:hypothetical protein
LGPVAVVLHPNRFFVADRPNLGDSGVDRDPAVLATAMYPYTRDNLVSGGDEVFDLHAGRLFPSLPLLLEELLHALVAVVGRGIYKPPGYVPFDTWITQLQKARHVAFVERLQNRPDGVDVLPEHAAWGLSRAHTSAVARASWAG